MPDPSAVRPPAPPEKHFTEDDVDLVESAICKAFGDPHGAHAAGRYVLEALASAGRLLPADTEHREEWGVRVNEPHPRRREVVGDVINLTESQARYGPKIWSGWSTVKRTIVAPGSWVEVEDTIQDPAGVTSKEPTDAGA